MVCSWDCHSQSFPAQASGGKKEEVIPETQKRVGARPTKVGRKKVTSCKVDDEVFHVGDSAYALAEGQTYEVLSQHWVHGISVSVTLVMLMCMMRYFMSFLIILLPDSSGCLQPLPLSQLTVCAMIALAQEAVHLWHGL